MTDNTKYNIRDLITNALEAKPLDFAGTFDSLIRDKLADAVGAKKMEIAQNLFNEPKEPTEEE